MELFKKQGVEIFSVGKWNGDDFTLEDLNEMVKSFDATKAGINPHIKIGHAKNQAFLQKEGLPSAGTIERVYVKGDKLVSDWKDIPKKIFELLLKGAWKKPSIEMFPKINIKGVEYKNLITAVALLGAETPGVMDLADIMAMYETDQEPKTYQTTLEFNFKENNRKETNMKTEAEIRAEVESELKLKAEADKAQALEAQVKEFASQKAATDQELKTLREEKAKADAKAIADAITLKESQTKEFVTSLKSEKLCTPAMEPLITALLGEEKKEYSVKLADKDQTLNKQELFKETLKLFSAAKEVNFTESSSSGSKDNKVDEDAQEKQVQEYMKANEGKTYGQAVKAVLAQNKNK